MDKEHHKLPRLYCDSRLGDNLQVELSEAQAHYIRNVMRMNESDNIRLFNGKDGEYLASLTTIKKRSASALCQKKIRDQAITHSGFTIWVPLIKKDRMDILIEKSVELGVYAIQPILTDHTVIRKTNEDRLKAQVIEAAEQCERLDIPEIRPLSDFSTLIDKVKTDCLFIAKERDVTSHTLSDVPNEAHIAFGPEGGWSEREIELFSENKLKTLTLGERVLRTETAVISTLACLENSGSAE